MGLEKELALACNPKSTFFIIFYCRKRLVSENLFIFASESKLFSNLCDCLRTICYSVDA